MNMLTRREVIQRALFGAAGLWLANKLPAHVFAELAAAPAKAKAVIQIWLWGGPPHLDTFDPKFEAGTDYAGPLRAIETNVPGVRICELLPELAKQADKYSIIRSMTHGNNGHETAAYMVQTGRAAGEKEVFPSAGAVVSLFKGYEAGYTGLIPPYIVVTEPQGRFDESGFIGARYKPFATGGDPAQPVFAVEGVVAPGVTVERQRARRDLLHSLNTLEHTLPGNSRLTAAVKCEHEAYDLILGDGGKVFDLSQEKNELRDRYGRNTFGQECLAARRMVEAGVPYVTISFPGGWDTHSNHFQTMRNQCPLLDQGLSTLLADLHDKGLLESTLVWCTGEFGRTPKVSWEPPWNGGRHHYGDVFTVLVAGGGFVGGRVVGSSDEKGEKVKERPVYPADLLGSMYLLAGIDASAKLPHPWGLDAYVLDTENEGMKSAGLLEEIM